MGSKKKLLQMAVSNPLEEKRMKQNQCRGHAHCLHRLRLSKEERAQVPIKKSSCDPKSNHSVFGLSCSGLRGLQRGVV